MRYHAEPFTEDQSKFYIGALLLALKALHSNCILHRDVKPDNILLDDDTGYPKLTDLSVSVSMRKGGDGDGEVHKHLQASTSLYAAPELAKWEHADSFLADYWSVGIILFEMLFQCHPEYYRTQLLLSGAQNSEDGENRPRRRSVTFNSLHRNSITIEPEVASAAQRRRSVASSSGVETSVSDTAPGRRIASDSGARPFLTRELSFLSELKNTGPSTTSPRGGGSEQGREDDGNGCPDTACEMPDKINGVPVTSECKDLLTALLAMQPWNRLGNENGVEDIQNHAFFRGFDWSKLENLEMEPPLSIPEKARIVTNPRARERRFTVDHGKQKGMARKNSRPSLSMSDKSIGGLSKEMERQFFEHYHFSNADGLERRRTEKRNRREKMKRKKSALMALAVPLKAIAQETTKAVISPRKLLSGRGRAGSDNERFPSKHEQRSQKHGTAPLPHYVSPPSSTTTSYRIAPPSVLKTRFYNGPGSLGRIEAPPQRWKERQRAFQRQRGESDGCIDDAAADRAVNAIRAARASTSTRGDIAAETPLGANTSKFGAPGPSAIEFLNKSTVLARTKHLDLRHSFTMGDTSHLKWIEMSLEESLRSLRVEINDRKSTDGSKDDGGGSSSTVSLGIKGVDSCDPRSFET